MKPDECEEDRWKALQYVGSEFCTGVALVLYWASLNYWQPGIASLGGEEAGEVVYRQNTTPTTHPPPKKKNV